MSGKIHEHHCPFDLTLRPAHDCICRCGWIYRSDLQAWFAPGAFTSGGAMGGIVIHLVEKPAAFEGEYVRTWGQLGTNVYGFSYVDRANATVFPDAIAANVAIIARNRNYPNQPRQLRLEPASQPGIEISLGTDPVALMDAIRTSPIAHSYRTAVLGSWADSYLFAGGPVDGKRLVVEGKPSEFFVTVAMLEKMTWAPNIGLLAPIPTKSARYRRINLHPTSNAKDVITVYAFAGFIEPRKPVVGDGLVVDRPSLIGQEGSYWTIFDRIISGPITTWYARPIVTRKGDATRLEVREADLTWDFNTSAWAVQPGAKLELLTRKTL